VENQKILKLNSEMVAIGQTTAIVAHDVRKPLTNMKALLAMLPTIKDSPEKISLMQKNVEESINQTNTLLNEILEFSKDSTSLDRQNYSLQKIIQASLSNSVNNCEDVDLAVDYDLKHSNQVFVDYDKIVRVLANIFDNSLEAIRLMNGDGPNVQLRVSSFDVSHDDKKFISLSILDNGPGISPEIIDKIFNVYFTYNKKGGTGLGLAICKRIVNLHGGKIFAHNNPSGGVRVIIELPVGTRKEKIIEEDLMRSYRRQSVRPLKNEYPRFGILDSGKKDEGNLKKLLIADDEDIVRESIKVAIGNHPDLKQQIYILEVDSAEKALHILKNERCDCLITDIDFGRNKMNGYELVEKVLTKYSDIDVLIHSNKCQGEFDRRIDEINSKKFKGCVPKLMKRSYLTDFLLNQESANKSKQNVLIINDDDAVLVSLGILFKASGCEVAHAGNSNKAVELFEKNNFDLIVSDLKLECDTMNGYDILRHFRRTGDRTPFYIVSGSSKRTEEKIAIEYGADGYFQLPIDNGDIEKMLTYRT
ncbi:response regulator, partial [bacterium]|nr:response regulator [bacterium]